MYQQGLSKAVIIVLMLAIPFVVQANDQNDLYRLKGTSTLQRGDLDPMTYNMKSIESAQKNALKDLVTMLISQGVFQAHQQEITAEIIENYTQLVPRFYMPTMHNPAEPLTITCEVVLHYLIMKLNEIGIKVDGKLLRKTGLLVRTTIEGKSTFQIPDAKKSNIANAIKENLGSLGQEIIGSDKENQLKEKGLREKLFSDKATISKDSLASLGARIIFLGDIIIKVDKKLAKNMNAYTLDFKMIMLDARSGNRRFEKTYQLQRVDITKENAIKELTKDLIEQVIPKATAYYAAMTVKRNLPPSIEVPQELINAMPPVKK